LLDLTGGNGSAMVMTKYIKNLCVALMAGALSACGTSTLMSEADEAKIGAQQHPNIVREYGGAYKDPRVNAYVQAVMARIGAFSDRPDIDYKITVLDTPMVNAFALPGGYTYVTRGLLALADNEAELAGVIGHEIAHVTARHGARRQTAAVGTAVVAGVLGVMLNARTGLNAGLTGDLLNVGGSAILAGYSRDNEYEADNLGIKAMARAGYEPRAQGDLLTSLAAFAAYQSGGKKAQAGWFSTHPNNKERIAKAQAKAASARSKTATARDIGTERHLRMIDGMVFGDGAREGIIRGRRYEHAMLALRFDVPRGFMLKNGKSRVTAAHDNKVQIIFDLDARIANEEPEAYLRSTWAPGKKLSGFQNLTIDGRKAALGTLKTQNGIAVLLAIDGGEKQIMRFGVLAPRGRESDAEAAMAGVRRAIDFLTPSEVSAIRPYRLRVVTVKPGQSVSTLAGLMRGPIKDKEGLFRVLNGLQKNEQIAAGARVKLIGD
jgi:predicted Zn-dependent protease